MRHLNQLSLALIVLTGAFTSMVTSAVAGDSIYFRQTAATFHFGFDGRACSSIPLPGVLLDGEDNCARVPSSYVETDANGEKIRKRLSGTRKQTVETQAVGPDGTPIVLTDTLEIEDNPSVFGSYGARTSLGITGILDYLNEARSEAFRARFFATGAAAQFVGDGAGAYLENSGKAFEAPEDFQPVE
ncbi:MAG: hypothetical protein ACE363_05960 [Alphaproteobacteria bacterium]